MNRLISLMEAEQGKSTISSIADSISSLESRRAGEG